MNKNFKILTLLIIISSAISVFSSDDKKLKEIPNKTFGDSTYSKKVLIASSESEFKREISFAIAESLAVDSVFVQLINGKMILEHSPKNYSAVVILNTCMAWKIEKKVEKFFEKYPKYSNIVLYTTSGDKNGCGKGKKIPDYVDATSSASVEENMDSIINDILSTTRKNIK